MARVFHNRSYHVIVGISTLLCSLVSLLMLEDGPFLKIIIIECLDAFPINLNCILAPAAPKRLFFWWAEIFVYGRKSQIENSFFT